MISFQKGFLPRQDILPGIELPYAKKKCPPLVDRDRSWRFLIRIRYGCYFRCGEIYSAVLEPRYFSTRLYGIHCPDRDGHWRPAGSHSGGQAGKEKDPLWNSHFIPDIIHRHGARRVLDPVFDLPVPGWLWRGG